MSASDNSLEIIYEDQDLIAINKPHGLLVHRTKMAKDAHHFALQTLRDQVGYKVFPTHRLDRKTSGVLLFAKSKEVNVVVQKMFHDRKVKKDYLSIVRGWVDDHGIIDYPLAKEGSNLASEKVQPAITSYQLISKFEIPLGLGMHKTSRYSFIRLSPTTGRFHQLRKHMAHIFHPIIGDRPHGCNKQNKFWKESIKIDTMLLHAESLTLNNMDKETITISAALSEPFQMAKAYLAKNNILFDVS